MESLLFMSPEPRVFSDFETLFEGEFSAQEIKKLLEELQNSYNKKERGLQLEKVSKGWQLRTKTENKQHLLKIKPPVTFRLSRPSLETLSIIAFEQPCTKMEIDEIRGVESGHLLRNLMEKELICLSGKSHLPGKPSLYKTSRKFLEAFGLETIKDLPSQEEIEELLSEIKTQDKEDLPSISDKLFQTEKTTSNFKDEQENKKIKDVLKSLPSTVEFLEREQAPEPVSSVKRESPISSEPEN